MKLRKDGTPDKRFKTRTTEELDKKEKPALKDVDGMLEEMGHDDIKEDDDSGLESIVDTGTTQATVGKTVYRPFPSKDPNLLHNRLLKDNNLKLDFDVLEGTIATKYGIIKLEKPTLVIKASYVTTE